MTDKQLLKDLAKDKPIAAISALIDKVVDYHTSNNLAHEQIMTSVQAISDKIYSKKGNGSCITDQLERGQRQMERLEDKIEEMKEQPKDEHSGEPIERRAGTVLEVKKEAFKDLPIDRKIKTIVLCLTLVSLVGLLGASFLGFGEDIAKSFFNNFISK